MHDLVRYGWRCARREWEPTAIVAAAIVAAAIVVASEEIVIETGRSGGPRACYGSCRGSGRRSRAERVIKRIVEACAGPTRVLCASWLDGFSNSLASNGMRESLVVKTEIIVEVVIEAVVSPAWGGSSGRSSWCFDASSAGGEGECQPAANFVVATIRYSRCQILKVIKVVSGSVC